MAFRVLSGISGISIPLSTVFFIGLSKKITAREVVGVFIRITNPQRAFATFASPRIRTFLWRLWNPLDFYCRLLRSKCHGVTDFEIEFFK